MMFIHLNIFKRKEEKFEVGHPELTRKNRVEKSSRKQEVRPRTAPGVLELPTQGPGNRQSIQHDVQLVDEPLPAPVPLYAAARVPTPRDEFSRPPFGLRRSLSSASCVIRNPFRNDTSESVATIGHLTERSTTESVDVIQRTVPSHTPTRKTTPPCIAPQRAAIFTRQDPLSDSDDTLTDCQSPAIRIALTRSKSFDNVEISCTEKLARPPLRRSSHEDIILSRHN
ncbi:hypothetical protein GSI_13558 [Ganoderma sinense ZZ0214-1]|uniref:Uncharacterized protein n=1 Tax=Ganoderma sinense ZZ0214-1 TaxID=1077348 RepID=A0A2G8RQM7_9APHY|nr:hypothetical protein GSI_13558 [Ganoderma sinense ZZ0214-1]